MTQCVLDSLVKGETGKGLDCAHPLVSNNRAPISWASSIMSVEVVWQDMEIL